MKLSELLAAFVLVVCLLIAGYGKGKHDTQMAQEADKTAAAKQALRMVEAEARRSADASTAFIADRDALQTDFQTLQEKYDDLRRHGLPLTVARSAGATHIAGTAAFPSGAACVATPGADQHPGQANPETACVLVALPDAGVELSLGAVRLWNGALTNTDAPAGACGADGAPAEACAVGAGLGIEAAWDNHATNALSCAQDRQRLKHLIDYIEKAQEGQP